MHDLRTMELRYTLPLLALFTTPAAYTQVVENEFPPVAVEVVEEPTSHDPNEPHSMVEEMPAFPGGHEAMMKHLSRSLKYPDEAAENGIQGKVFVAFVVERDGSINEVKVLRGIGGGCDQEAIRVVKGMPKWTPGKLAGKEVRVRYNLPIIFKLQEPNDE